ncbi:MAG: transglutaminase family protein [Rhodospirillales bacterium]|nr:transglutaminase family protein [Rhodospirillales bacterium]
MLAFLRRLMRRVRNELAFRADVRAPVAKVPVRKEGVCADFTHPMIASMRGRGLPARCVSG